MESFRETFVLLNEHRVGSAPTFGAKRSSDCNNAAYAFDSMCLERASLLQSDENGIVELPV